MKNISQLSRIMGWAGLVVCLFTLAGQVWADAVLPFVDKFNGGSLDSGNWVQSGGVTVQGVVKIESSGNAVGIGGTAEGSVTLNVDASANYQNVWVQIYSQPGRFVSPPAVPDSAVACAFYVRNSDGMIMVRDQVYDEDIEEWVNEWVSTGKAVPAVPPDPWVGFAVHADYINKKWDLYYTTDPYSAYASMTLARGNIAFHTDGDGGNLSQVSVTSEKQAYIDNVAVSKGITGVAAGSPTPIAVQEIAFENVPKMVGLLGNNLNASGTPPDNSLAGIMGDLLKTLMYAGNVHGNPPDELPDGDQVLVWDGAGVRTYTYNTQWAGEWYSGSDVPSAEEIGASQSLWIKRQTAGSAYAFGTYTSVGGVPPGAPGPTIINEADTEAPGFTALVWTGGDMALPADLGFDDSEAKLGDQILLWDIVDGSFHVLTWSIKDKTWKEGKTAYTMKTGQTYWVFRKDGTSTSYTK